jgi:hypothetical protein
MKTQTLIKKLEEKGFVYSSCLLWTSNDIDARLRAIGLESEIKFMSQTDKHMILTAFFEDHEDEICEFINQKLEQHLEDLTDYNLSEKPF